MNDLIEHTSVSAMAQAYADAVEEIRRGYELLRAAEQRLEATFSRESRTSFDAMDRYLHHGTDAGSAGRVVDKIRRNAWRCILGKLNIKAALSEKRWESLQKQLEEGELPEISEKSIEDMVAGFRSDLGAYFAEAVTEVFEFLRPRPGWNRSYKTNSEFEVGRKVVLTVHYRDKWGPSRWWRTYFRDQNLIAMDNVFHLLDGKRFQEGSHYGPLVSAMRLSEDGRGETDYFRFRCFQNGNIHIEFRRLDLLAQLNQIAGGRRLKTEAA